MEIIVISNQKGGAGKTTLSVNLSAGLAELGNKVLCIDLDPQCNATDFLLSDRVEDVLNINPSVYHFLKKRGEGEDIPLDEVIREASEEGVYILPSSRDMKSAEVEFPKYIDSQRLLLNAREDFESMGFDYVIVDTPPILTLVNLIALFFADRVIMPVNNSSKAIAGVTGVAEDLALVRRATRRPIKVNLVITKDMGTIASRRIAKRLGSNFEALMLKTTIPSGTVMERAEDANQSILSHDSKSRQAEAYRALAKEVKNL